MTKPDDPNVWKRIVNAPSVFNTHLAEQGRPPEDDTDEPAVIWGKRVGRGLAVIGALVIVAYLVDLYFKS